MAIIDDAAEIARRLKEIREEEAAVEEAAAWQASGKQLDKIAEIYGVLPRDDGEPERLFRERILEEVKRKLLAMFQSNIKPYTEPIVCTVGVSNGLDTWYKLNELTPSDIQRYLG